MNVKQNRSPVLKNGARKRRSSSPDMFDNSFEIVEGTPESTVPEECNAKERIVDNVDKISTGMKTKVYDAGKADCTRGRILSPVQNFRPPAAAASGLKSSSQWSLASSLRSTADTGNVRVNSLLKNAAGVSRCDTSRMTCTASETQAIYTLNTSVKNNDTPSLTYSGPFYGLSEQVWTIVQQAKSIKCLYQWQMDCLKKALSTDRNLLYSLPTSGGKTLVSEILMIRELLCSKKHCLYVLPYVSIVQEKVRTLSPLAVALDFAVEEFAGNRGSVPPRKRKSKNVIYIATLEKAHGIVNSMMEQGRLKEIGLVVVDEIHIIGETGRRGATLETLLCKLLLAPASPRIIAMSATIGNMNELSYFLKADVFSGDFRPVQLREFIKVGDSLLEVNDNHRRRDNILEPARMLSAPVAAIRQMDPDGLGMLVAEVVPDHCCLVFCPTKKNCESVAQLISRTLPKSILEYKTNEKRQLRQALQQESGQLCPILRATLPFGVAYHHSGLTADERQLIEESFLSATLCCLCCTSTLAAGVNLPARRVILRSPYMGSTRLSRARYQQMIGRAGRAGFDTHGESILIVKPTELQFIVNEILLAPIDRVDSQLAEDNLKGLQLLVLGLIALDVGASNRLQLADTLLNATLLGQQNGRLACSGEELVERSIDFLIGKQLLAETKNQLQVTKLGKATLKGCVDLDAAAQLYQDLRQAQAGLVLMSKLHLMYLVTPYDMVATVQPIPTTYFQAFNKLSSEEVGVAQTVGVNESVMVKLMAGQQPKLERFVLQRFYLTLMLNDLWKGDSFWNVAETYGLARGDVQNLLSSAASFASCVHHFTQELEEFWAFSELLLPFSRQLSMCCTSELIPLMELPSVAKGRARLFYKAGFKSLTDVAKSSASDLVKRVEHLPVRIAQQIIAAAKVLVFEKVDSLREEADSLLDLIPRARLLQPLDQTFQSQASNVSLLDD